MAGEPTIRDILQLMDKNADERHERTSRDISELHSDVADLRRDVQALQRRDTQRSALTAIGGRVWVAAIAALGVIVNIPAIMFYLGGAK